MDRLDDLEKILSAARDLGKNLQDDLDKLRADNAKLQDENKNLRADNEKLKSDSDSLLDEMETLENVVKNLRSANETFGINLNKLMMQLNQAINDNHEKFMAQINLLMRDEFQKFLTEYMSKIKADADNKNSQAGKKKSHNKENVSLTKTENLPTTQNNSDTKKIQYADFYAEENIGED